MPRYVQKPVIIDAMQYTGRNPLDVSEYVLPYGLRGGEHTAAGRELIIVDDKNGEAVHVASPGDWIIRGVAGECYPCKPDIFAATYEPADR